MTFSLFFDTAEELKRFCKRCNKTTRAIWHVHGDDIVFAKPLTRLKDELPRKGEFLIGGNLYQIKEQLVGDSVRLKITKLE